MGSAINLKVGDKEVKSTEISYDDLVILYNQYIRKYGEVPIYSKCDSKHNMPQGRIINRVIADKGITYNDFLLQFGKVSHVRTESKNYDIYVKRFKEVSDSIGHALVQNDLMNNTYGLPSSGWFIKNCPDPNVKTYDDFVLWCGYNSNKPEKDKDFVVKTLIDLEKSLGRPITKNDISYEKTGFSMIVLVRMFGGLTQAKEQLGLSKTISNPPLPFEYYKDKLDCILDSIKERTDRNFISWSDIENDKLNPVNVEHKTLTKAFKRENIDIFAYIKSKGFMMNPSGFSYHYTFDDGERVVSSMEYDFTKHLRSLGFVYNKNYFRDVPYKTFSNEKTKINCDYKIIVNDTPLYIEIAGIIYNSENEDWRKHNFSSKQEQDYQQKMINKEQRLLESGQHFLFLFRDEMFNGDYKRILQNEFNKMKSKIA